MKRKRVSVLLAILFVSLLQLAEAQQPGNVPRLGYLSGRTGRRSPNAEALRQGLRDLGYVEDRTSPSNTEGRREILIAFPPSPQSWYGSRLISSSPREARQDARPRKRLARFQLYLLARSTRSPLGWWTVSRDQEAISPGSVPAPRGCTENGLKLSRRHFPGSPVWAYS